jgi:hypothetical protein
VSDNDVFCAFVVCHAVVLFRCVCMLYCMSPIYRHRPDLSNTLLIYAVRLLFFFVICCSLLWLSLWCVFAVLCRVLHRLTHSHLARTMPTMQNNLVNYSSIIMQELCQLCRSCKNHANLVLQRTL